MEEILDGETKIEKTNVWITIVVSNIFIIVVVCTITTFFAETVTIFFIVAGIGVITSILLNSVMTLKNYFSSSSDWKKWAIVLAIILIIILGAFLYLYLVATSW